MILSYKRITKALISLRIRASAQAGLRLCCSQTTEDRYSRVEANLLICFLKEPYCLWVSCVKSLICYAVLCILSKFVNGHAREMEAGCFLSYSLHVWFLFNCTTVVKAPDSMTTLI